MNDSTQFARELLEATSVGSPANSSVQSAEQCRRVALVEGSSPHLSGELTSLLRYRLRVVAVLFFVASVAYFAKVFLTLDLSQPHVQLLLSLHTFITLVVLACAVSLCRKCPHSLKKLRFEELLIFGMPTALFLVKQYVDLVSAGRQGYVDSPIAPWFLLIFSYGMFIPNSWRRAAVVIAGWVVAPVVLFVALWMANDAVRQTLSFGDLCGMAIILLTGAVISAAGVHIIGTLRQEAFEARQFGQYRLRRRIGEGGMGEVYLAEHQLMKRPVAIKLIRPEIAEDPNVLARFDREVRATARLSHWNTIEIYDFGSTACGAFYYVMEYLPGLSLSELVKLHGPLSPERAVHLLRQACDGLREAHAIGLIHRDLKPANIFAAQRGGVYDVAKVLDFGLAKPLAQDDPDSVQLTQEGSITGSPLYMSPEQATGDSEPDARSDVYSLGAVAYYLLTGRPPFEGSNTLKILIAQAHEDVVPPSQLRPDVPRDLEQVVLRALAKKPERRFQSVSELEAALADCDAADRWTREDAAQWWQSNGQTIPTPEAERATLVA